MPDNYLLTPHRVITTPMLILYEKVVVNAKHNKTGLQPVSRTCGITPFGF